MKLRFYINKEKKKVYTLNEKIDSQETKPAHYKFIKIKSLEEYK